MSRLFDLYILDAAGNPVPCDDPLAWAEWLATAHRRVAQDRDESGATTLYVSTVFLGTGPLLWETMVFEGEGKACTILHDYTRRYRSRAEALAGHQAVCAAVAARGLL